jgi:O-antigen ligase
VATNDHHKSCFDLPTTLLFASSMFVLIEPAPFDILALVACSIIAFTIKVDVSPLRWLLLLVLVFGFIRMATLLHVDDLPASLRFFGITSYLTICCFIYASYIAKHGPMAVRAAVWGLYAGTLVTALAVMLTRAGALPLTDLVFYANDRAKGFFKDPNVLGPAAIPVAIFALADAARSRVPIMRAIYAGLFAMATWLVFMSFSRGAWVAYLAAVVAFLMCRVLQINSSRMLGGLLLILVALGGAVTMVVYSANNFGLMGFARERLERKSYDDDRFAVQEHLLEMSSVNVFGHGPGQANIYGELVGASGSGAAHSTYVRVVFEYGWIGAVVFFLLMTATLIAATRGVRSSSEWSWLYSAMLACFVALLVSALAVDTLHWRHLWIVVSLIWGMLAWQNLNSYYVLRTNDVA